MRSYSRYAKTPTLFLLLLGMFSLAAEEASAQYFRFGKNKVHYDAHDWHYVQSRHFDVYYYEPNGKYVAEFTARAAEEAYQQISDLFQHQISDRIALIVYQSHNDFAVTNVADLPTESEGIGGVTELFKNRVAIPFNGNYRDFDRVLHHEIVHAVVNDMFYGGSIQSIIQNNIQLVIPLWFNEGIAEYSALGWDTDSDMWMRDAIVNNYLPPIPQLGGFLAYRGGQGVWDYVAEQYGKEKISEILQRLRLTRSVDASFQRSIGLSLRELTERWQKTLREVHWPEIAAREDLESFSKPIITRERGGLYNTSPALSPQGDRIVYISTHDGFFNVYLANATDGKIIRRLVSGNDNTQFESLKILNPNLTWSPDGNQIALATKSGPSDAVALVDVNSGRARHYRVPGLQSIVSVAWSPDGSRVAFEGSDGIQSDIYILNLETNETTNLTNDIFSNHEPTWSPDSRHIVFHSDRKDYVDLGTYTAENFNMMEHDFSQLNLYMAEVDGNGRLERLTTSEIWDSRSGKFGSDPAQLLFISDRNGIWNVYQKDLESGTERPVTDVVVGITQLSVSADGRRAAFVSLKEGTQSIYMMNDPFDRNLDQNQLTPNVWAQRVTQDEEHPAPAVALASQSLLRQNPLLRDAVDGVPYHSRTTEPRELFAAVSQSSGSEETSSDGDTLSAVEAEEAENDTTAYGGVRVDFRNYVFSDAFDEARSEDRSRTRSRFEVEDNVDEDGNFRPREYRLSFSPDIIYGAAQFDNLYGMQSVTQMQFSDMLGNHRIYAATNLLIDLRNSDYLVAYSYLPNRIDWTVSGFHISRILPDYQNFRYIRYRYYGGGITASYPLDKFRRFDLDVSVMGISQTDIQAPQVPTSTHTLLNPSLTYTRDVTVPGFLSPSGGYRYAFSLSGSPGSVTGSNIQFGTLLGDFRWYASLGRMYTFAVRFSGATSFGPNPQLFYTSGVPNWINYRYDPDNGFPITDLTDFVFATPVLPLRAYDINTQHGSNFGLMNAEFRFPLIAAMLPGPIPIMPLYNIEGSTFLDVGSVFGGPRGEPFQMFRRDEEDRQVFDKLLVGAGFGVRTILLGFPVRLDFAWPHDGQQFGQRRTYFSIGLDF